MLYFLPCQFNTVNAINTVFLVDTDFCRTHFFSIFCVSLYNKFVVSEENSFVDAEKFQLIAIT